MYQRKSPLWTCPNCGARYSFAVWQTPGCSKCGYVAGRPLPKKVAEKELEEMGIEALPKLEDYKEE